MEWEVRLRYVLPLARGQFYEEVYKLCMGAYAEGCMEEKRKAIEAYRLRCNKLFGNRCMDFSVLANEHKRICDGDCYYIRKYKSELYKLEDRAF